MAEVKTIEVRWPAKFKSAIVRINAADFDPSIHELPDSPTTKEPASAGAPVADTAVGEVAEPAVESAPADSTSSRRRRG